MAAGEDRHPKKKTPLAGGVGAIRRIRMQTNNDTGNPAAKYRHAPEVTAYVVLKIAAMLRIGNWVGTSEIRKRLADEVGVFVDLRTVQRHLYRMAEIFPIESNDANPKGYRWMKTDEAREMREIAEEAA